MLVANHASYLDPLVLVAVLPSSISFVAKRELAEQFFARTLFRRLGAEFVERFDPQRGVEDTDRVLQAVRQVVRCFFSQRELSGVRLAPTLSHGRFRGGGTDRRATGADGLTGTRSILRAGQWFPRRGPVTVTIGTPIMPQGANWTSAIALRDAARAQMLAYSHEPDLAPEFEASPSMPFPTRRE